jgi:hypothetical protein
MKSNYIITRMQIGEFEVPVPQGLSELLNQSGAWGDKLEAPQLNEYDRLVEMRNGKLFTVLKKKTTL